MIYEHKEYLKGFCVVDYDALDMMKLKTEIAKECMGHELQDGIFAKVTRRYRRGRNRCRNCGLKLK